MSNEKLTIQKDKARLTVIGRSYPDENTDSGTGIDLTQELIDILEDLDIDLPPIDFDDWDDIPVIIGYDDDGNPILIYPDPETDEIIEWPIDFPIEEIDWPDVDITPDWIDNQPVIIIETDGEDPIIWPIELPDGIDPEDWTDFDITPIVGPGGELDIVFEDPDTGIDYNIDVGDLDIDGLSDLYDLDWMLDMDIAGLDSLTGLDVDISLDTDFSIKVENVPTEIVIVTPPKKLKYIVGQRLDFTGMVVKAVKSDGSTWTSAKYPNGHIPLGELYLDPLVAEFLSLDDFIMRTDRCSSFTTNVHIQATAANGGIIFINRNDELLMKVTFMAEHQGLAGYWGNSPVYANTLVYDNGERQVWKSAQKSYSHNCWLNLNPYYKEDVELDEGEMKKLLGSVQITWCRPSDKKALTAYLEITVMSRAGGGGR
jgi:hypothetical protein